jgi:hypothetical protein
MRRLLTALVALALLLPAPAFAVTILVTASSDTQNTFRTNSNTNFANLNSGLSSAGFSTTSLIYAALQGLGFSTTSAAYFITATTTLPSITTLANLGTVKTSLSGVLYGNSGVLAAVATGTISASGPLSVTANRYAVGGSAAFSITQSGIATDGYLSSTDWNLFNNKISSSSLSGSSPITYNSSTGVIACPTCTINGSSFPFTPSSLGNSTSTLIIDTAGIIASASSTIGSGTQIGGLTISGGSTTTLNAYFASGVGIGATPGSIASTPLTISAQAVNSEKLKILGSGNPTTYAALGDQASGSNGWYLGLYITGTLKARIDSQGSSYVPLNFGVGTTSPYANLSVQNVYGTATNALFSVASTTSSTGATGNVVYSIDATGSSTQSNGITLTAGCFKVGGACLTSGISDHTLLSNLAWTSSGHTGTANTFASFSSTGVAVASTTLSPFNGGTGVTSLSTGDLVVGAGTGPVTSTSTLAANKGGTGQNTNAWTGLPLTTAGVWSQYAGTSCTNQFVRSVSASGVATCATVGATDVSLAALTATDSTLTFSGSYTGAAARTIGLNLANPNTWTGVQTINFASSTAITISGAVYIPNSSSQAPTVAGQLALDTTDDQLQIGDGSNTAVFDRFKYLANPMATTTAWAGTTTQNQVVAPFAGTLKDVQCKVPTGTLNVQVFVNSTKVLPMVLSASSTVGTYTFTSANTFSRGDVIEVDYGTPASSPTQTSCTVRATVSGT